MATAGEKNSNAPDTSNDVGLLKRREIEARIVGPMIEALAAEFGAERVRAIVRDLIVRLARESGAQVARSAGGCTLAHFAQALDLWKMDNALELDILEQTAGRLSFNVTRCRYAEMYRALGMQELGALLSCNRDFSFIEGFNPEIALTRTQTIMEGAPHCDFRFTHVSHDEATHQGE